MLTSRFFAVTLSAATLLASVSLMSVPTFAAGQEQLPEASAKVQPDLPGYEELTVTVPQRARPVAAPLWYPAEDRTYERLVGDNAVFVGNRALMGPKIAAGKHPLVILEHGSGGRVELLSWLANGLVAQGYMVVGIDHPGSMTGDSSPRRTIRHWERNEDEHALLDTLLSDPTYAPHIDTSNISVIGFSIGGLTAMTLAGGRLDLSAVAAYCAGEGRKTGTCLFFEKGGVQYADVPTELFDADLKDTRITRAVAIDPGLVGQMQSDSLEKISIPMMVINLGQGDDRIPEVDAGPKGARLGAKIPLLTYEEVAPAHHFTFLGLCKPGAAEILKEEHDDPICSDPEGANRNLIHRRLTAIIGSFLKSETARGQL